MIILSVFLYQFKFRKLMDTFLVEIMAVHMLQKIYMALQIGIIMVSTAVLKSSIEIFVVFILCTHTGSIALFDVL